MSKRVWLAGVAAVVAMTGSVQLQGWLGRLLQPLVRF